MFTAIFDLDGTLADTSGDLLAAANRVFAEAGYKTPLTGDDFETALLGGRAMLRLGVERLGLQDGEAFVSEGYQPLLGHYEAALCNHTALYPDVHPVLGRLRDAGWNLGVCTNKPYYLAKPLLHFLGLSEYFGEAVIGADSLPVSKPAPEPLIETIKLAGGEVTHAVLVGDSATDYNTAKNAEAMVLLVDFEKTEIQKKFPDAPVVGDYGQLEKWLQNWRSSLSP